MMRTFFLLCALVVAGLFAIAAPAENWPEFRGPTGQGFSTARNLPVEWRCDPKGTSKNIRWKQAIPGQGWSSPVLFENNLYLTTAVRDEQSAKISLRAISLDASLGTPNWGVEIFSVDDSVRIHTKNSQASPTPVVADGKLYVHFGHRGTACLDLKGQVLWRNSSLSYAPVHGNGGSPVVVDGALIFSCDGASDPIVVALDKSTGEILWKVKRDTDAKRKFSFSTPLLIQVNGRKQVISPGSNALCAYDPRTGQEIWRVRYDGYSVVPRPVYGHGLVFISTGFDGPTVMAIRPDGQGDVTETHVAWTLKRGAPNTPSLLLAGDELYMVSDGGIASCVDARRGRVHWQERLGGNFSASPVYAEGRIYCQNEEGVGVVLQAGKTFRKLSTNPLGERTLASYAVGEGALFIRGEQHLFRIEQAKF